MAQTWHDLAFIHWPLPPAALRPFVRPPLELDLFEGQAWIAVVPFWMSGLRPRLIPPLPWFSTAVELNVRTYVTYLGIPGVLFLSLDINKWPAVHTARALYHLPYFHARMSISRDRRSTGPQPSEDPSSARPAAPSAHLPANFKYFSDRADSGAPSAEFHSEYGPTGPVCLSTPGSLEHFLTERYCLYSYDSAGRLYRAHIHHLPWPLQPATAEIHHNTMAAALGIDLPSTKPLFHYSQFLKVAVWWPDRLV